MKLSSSGMEFGASRAVSFGVCLMDFNGYVHVRLLYEVRIFNES